MSPTKLTIEEARAHADAAERNGLHLQTMSEFLAEPDEVIAWLVEELLPASGLSELVAKPKVGKSTLARCLAVSVARGQPFLDRITHPGPVIYCAFEEKRSEVRRHLRQLGATTEDPIHVLIGATPDDFVTKLRGSIEALRPVLVIIDPMIRLTRVKDLSAYAEVAAALEPILNLARETGAHVMLVHHGRKSEGEGGDQSLGSTAIFGTADIGIFLRKRDGARYVLSEERYGRGFETEYLLPLDPVTGWVVLGVTRREHAQHERQPVILEWLASQAAPIEERTLLEELEGQKALLQAALRQLVKEGRVCRTGGGKRGDPYRYRLSSEAAEAEKVAEVAEAREAEKAASDSTSLPPAYIPGGREVETPAPDVIQEPLYWVAETPTARRPTKSRRRRRPRG